jgi:hypothetical protein
MLVCHLCQPPHNHASKVGLTPVVPNTHRTTVVAARAGCGQGAPDMYSCHPYAIPDSIPGEREFVGVRVGLDSASHLHHILLMECPGEATTVYCCTVVPL